MSPSAVASVNKTDMASNLTEAGVKHTIKDTAPSIAVNGHSTGLQELDASKITFTPNENPKAVPEANSPEVTKMSREKFVALKDPTDLVDIPLEIPKGRSMLERDPRSPEICTDHMITATWTSKTGWTAPSLIPYGPLALQPHASVLHYSTSCFEGMKFYRGHDLKIRLFRPSLNTVRMLNSSARISLPAFPPAELQKLIETLVAVEGEKWLPKSRPGSFMYLRPTMIGTAPTLSVNKPNEVLLYIIACCFPDFNDPAATLGAHANANNNESPNGNSETKPRPGLKLLASKEDTIRAWPGGFGFAKVGANYGPSLLASDEAHLRGFNQILWLFGPDSEITEAGASNFFLVWKTREGRTQLVTAPLGDGIILAGVTRRSVLELARERIGGEELEVVERKICMWELEEAVNEGRLMEAFAAGTAYFIMPISLIHYRGTDLHIPFADDNYGSKLKQWLMDIMYGAESHEWGVVVQERSLIPSDLDE